MIYLYRELQPDEFILIGADPAEGGDYSAFVAISKHKADVVMLGRSKEESSQLGHTLNHVGKWINKKTNIYPCIAPERNTGAATIYCLKELNYPEIYKMPQSFTKSEELPGESYGWITSSTSRPKMLDDLALAVRQKAIGIPSKILIDEMYSFIRNARTGKPQADISGNDDLVMALAIAWQLYQTQPTPEVDFSEIPDDTLRFKSGFY